MATEPDDELLARILARATATSGIDFGGYRSAVMARRIEHRAAVSACETLAEYVRVLDSDPAEAPRLVDALLIKTTELFREPRTLELLGEVLPALVDRRTAEGQTQLRAWVAGCSTGEEAYSVACVLHAVIEALEHPLSVRVFGSDADANALDVARRGVVPSRIIPPTIPLFARRFFTPSASGLLVAPEIRAITSFSFHDLLDEDQLAPDDAVVASFDVVSCRNVLIYLEGPHRRRVVERLVDAVEPGGLLLLGDAESSPPEEATSLVRLAPSIPLFTKNG